MNALNEESWDRCVQCENWFVSYSFCQRESLNGLFYAKYSHLKNEVLNQNACNSLCSRHTFSFDSSTLGSV